VWRLRAIAIHAGRLSAVGEIQNLCLLLCPVTMEFEMCSYERWLNRNGEIASVFIARTRSVQFINGEDGSNC